MNLHEYQSKELFTQNAIPVPKKEVADSPVSAVATSLGGSLWVIKAQIHAGGRSQAVWVKVIKDLEAVRAVTKAMLGTKLVTHQTGTEGLSVHPDASQEDPMQRKAAEHDLNNVSLDSKIACIVSRSGTLTYEGVFQITPAWASAGIRCAA